MQSRLCDSSVTDSTPRGVKYVPRVGSLRTNITMAAVAAVAPALFVGGMLFLRGFRSSLISREDFIVVNLAQQVAEGMEDGTLPELISTPNDDTFAQVIDAAQRPIAASAELVGAGPVLNLAEGERYDPDRSLRLSIDPEDPFRVHTMVVATPSGAVTILTGFSLSRVDETVTSARTILMISFPLLVGLVALICWRSVGRALRPVDAIREEVSDISGRQLSRRVPEPRTNDEIARLARTMNEMLDRLERSADRQRQFVSDASHELRSPLAASRADLELAMAHPQQVDSARVLADLLKDNDRMSGLVRDLLYLAQSDEGATIPAIALLDLDEVVRQEARRTRSRDGVTTDLSKVHPIEIRGNTEHLGRLVANLLNNAVRHAQHAVAVSLDVIDDDAVLVVSDDGPGIPEELSERIFERFSRLDASRTRDSGGTGLGLAITREIAAAHGGTVVAAASPAGARMVVTLPIAGPSRRSR